MTEADGWLLDMLLYAREARRLVADVSREQFDSDRTLQYALIHVVTIVGEAAAQVPAENRSELTSIPWGKIIGTRNRLVHHYFKIDMNILWEVIQVHIPDLIQILESVVPQEKSDSDESST